MTTTRKTSFNLNWLFLAAAAALLVWTFTPSFLWMVDRWKAPDSYFAHGFLIPLVTAYWIWEKRATLAATELKSSAWGLPFLIVAALMQIFAAIMRVYFLSCFSFVICLFGISLAAAGTKFTRQIAFPLFFLFLMVPLPLLVVSETTLRMKFFVTELATTCLNAIGFKAYRNGSYLVMPNSFLLVGDPCSGLRSFLAFLCLGFVFAYGGKTKWWGKAILIFAGLPLAIFSNLLRVFGLALIAEIYGQEAVHGKIHDASGFVVFVIAFALFMLIRRQLEAARA